MIDAGLLDRVRRRLAEADALPNATSVAEVLRAEETVVGSNTVLAIVDRLQAESTGTGILEPLLKTPGITDILVNGTDGVYIDSGSGLRRSSMTFDSDASVRRLAQRLAAQAGRRLDDASPWVDGRLANGVRLHAVLAPVSRPGTIICLRVPPLRRWTLAELLGDGVDGPLAEVLNGIISRQLAFVISGGTGTGKTTLLAAMLATVPAGERIVIVEDATELRPDHCHVVGLEARPANAEGAGRVTVRDLVRQALRMRPDRLVVGEVRGDEVVDLLAALNTGHRGGAGTVHANSAGDVPRRLEALAMAAGLSRTAAHAQMAAGLDVVIHVERTRHGIRRIGQIGVFDADESGLATVHPALTNSTDGLVSGPGHDVLAEMLRW